MTNDYIILAAVALLAVGGGLLLLFRVKKDEELGVLADAAMAAADRAADSIDETLSSVDASNKRIAAMEAKAIKDRKALDLMVPVGKEEK